MQCPMCGNITYPVGSMCRYCGSTLEWEEQAGRLAVPLHKIVNLKWGRPLVETALKRLDSELRLARSEHVKVLTLIHGYGSSGKGGKIRDECRKVLQHLVQRGELNSFIPGEQFHTRSGAGKSLIRRYPGLEKLCAADLDNPGVTIVVF